MHAVYTVCEECDRCEWCMRGVREVVSGECEVYARCVNGV